MTRGAWWGNSVVLRTSCFLISVLVTKLCLFVESTEARIGGAQGDKG